MGGTGGTRMKKLGGSLMRARTRCIVRRASRVVAIAIAIRCVPSAWVLHFRLCRRYLPWLPSFPLFPLLPLITARAPRRF